MGSEWEYTTLGECADWYSGGTPRKSCPQYWDGDIPWISAKSLKDFHVRDSEDRVTSEGLENGTRLVPTDAILFVVRGMSLKSEFRLGVAQRPVSFNQDIKAIVAKDDYLPYFLAYILKGKTAEILDLVEEAGHGTGVLPTDVIKNIEIPAISKAEQKGLVEIFQAIDDKIELNRRMNATLEGMAQALFKSWFVDFDPVLDNPILAGNPIPDEFAERAKVRQAILEQYQSDECSVMNDELKDSSIQNSSLKTHHSPQAPSAGNAIPDELASKAELRRMNAECQPSAIHHSSLSPHHSLFPAAFQFTKELGWIPEGWEISSFGDVSNCFDRKRIPLSKKQREEKNPGGIPYYGATSIMDFIDEWIFDDTYLLVGEDGSVMKEDGSPFIQYIWGKTWVNNHAHVLQGDDGVSTEHLMLFMQAQDITPYVTGAVQLKINQKNMNSIPFLNACSSLNQRFSEFITPFYERIKKLTEENETLTKLRDSLLPKLLCGEIQIQTEAQAS